ncbi:MAG: hypothetical protein R3E01_07355 [Pirellulaceae bacterium]|nr:hypothetical protein [Planctomycetales bacterium]
MTRHATDRRSRPRQCGHCQYGPFPLIAIWLCVFAGCAGGDQSADRRVAEWVLENGGQVAVVRANEETRVDQRRGLPRTEFELFAVAWDIYPGDRNPRVTDAELERFAELQHLKELDLWASDVSDQGLTHLKKLISLERLQLSQTRVTDAGLKELEQLSNLRQLALLDCPVTAQGVRRLQRALPSCRISFKGK